MTHRNIRAPFLALTTALLVATTAFSAGIREKQLDSAYTAEVFKRDGSVAATGNLALGGNKITGSAAGTAAGDLVTKAQLDSVSGGIIVKSPARVATDDVGEILDDNASLTAAAPVYSNTGGTSSRGQITAVLAVSGTFTVDGVSLVDNDRILIGAEGEAGGLGGDANGCWYPTIVGTALTLDRCTDYDEDAEVVAGNYFFIQEGTVHGGHSHVLSTPDPIVIGGASGTSLSFVMYTAISLADTAPPSVDAGDAGVVGTSSQAAREDHQHAVSTGTASSASTGQTNTEGTSTDLARADHGHAHTRSAPTSNLGGTSTNAVGASGDFADAAHTHAIDTGTTTAATAGQTGSAGSGANLAHANHEHAHARSAALAVSTANGIGSSGNFADAEHLHDSPQMTDANKREAASVTTGTNETTGLTIANVPALGTHISIVMNTVVYDVGDGVDTSDFYYSNDACTTPRATASITSGDVLCQGDNLPFNLDTSDEISQNYLTFTNN